MRLPVLAIAMLAVAMTAAGCDGGGPATGSAPAACALQPGAPAVPTMVFRDFLGARPTPAEFRDHYPGIALVMPGDVATREVRLDCSRFFADTGDDGHIIGGRFG